MKSLAFGVQRSRRKVPPDGDWHAGLGLGVRYNSFVGPIRLDVATPASGDDAFDDVQLYIGIGQAF